MSAPLRFTKIKITLGYLLLLCILFMTLWLVKREVAKLSVLDTEQILHVDTLQMLLKEKDRGTLDILYSLHKVDNQLISDEDIAAIFSQQDSAMAEQHIRYRTIIKQDTVVNQPPKKGFFKRLGSVFAPQKDTALVVNTTKELIVDTIVAVPHSIDSLQERVRVAAQQKMEERQKLMRYNTNRIRRLNEQTTARIDSLITQYEEILLSYVREESQKQQDMRRKSTYILAGVAGGALLLAALFLILIWIDIAKSNRYRKELEEAHRRTSELLHAREKLMLTITHDFKAPLSSIIGYTDLMMQQPLDSRQRFYLENMRGSTGHLMKLVTDLLEFYRLDINHVQIERVAFCPNSMFDEIAGSFLPLVEAKGLSLRYHIESELSSHYAGDPLRIRQIVENLLSNAVKFTASGNISLSVSYTQPLLKVEVSDTGQGIAPEERSRIFEEFTRLPGAQGQEGFGLGLSIVAKLVHLLDGNITVENNEAGGARFELFIPIYPIREAISPREEKKDKVDLQSMPLRVLLIDDDKMQLDLTAAMLAQRGITTVCCRQMEELIEYLRREQFDVLLTDVQMPAINGFELLTLLRASNIPQARTIPVIAVTARSDSGQEAYRTHGFAGCLCKPFRVDDFFTLLGEEPSKENAPEKIVTDNGVIDFSVLTAFSEGDPKASRQIMSSFVDETLTHIHQLKSHIENKDLHSVSALSHKLLPIFTLLKINDITALLTELEAVEATAFSQPLFEKAELLLQRLKEVLNVARKQQIS